MAAAYRRARTCPAWGRATRTGRRRPARYFVPFSSMHVYRRSDSIWANQYRTSLSDYAAGFRSSRCEVLPAYIRYDCETDQVEEIRPTELPLVVHDPAEFGDDWSEPVEAADVATAEGYFKSIEHLSAVFDFVNLRVGGRDNFIALGKRRYDRGVTFEAPRQSLVTAVQYEIFDDPLIGNFMKPRCTATGDPGAATLISPRSWPHTRTTAAPSRGKSSQIISRRIAIAHYWISSSIASRRRRRRSIAPT